MNVFTERKRPTIWIIPAVAVIFLVLLIVLGADTDQSGHVTKRNLQYNSEALGITLVFPAEWQDRYNVVEAEDILSVYSKEVEEQFSGGGHLFSINRRIGELITPEDVSQSATPKEILVQGNGYTYFINLPSDVQYPVDNTALSNEYQELSQQISEITESIELSGDQRPVASNEDYQLVGTSFFTVEIPEDWELKANEDTAAYWDLWTEDGMVGTISLVPYPHDPVVEASLKETNQHWEYLLNEDSSREIMIRTLRTYKNVNAVKIMKETLRFTADGPYNTVDFRTDALEYVQKGGQKIFGQIVEIFMSYGKPTAVKVNVLELVRGEEAANEPDGLLIKDTGKIRVYSLDPSCRVLPLIGPNYNRYGLYEMPLIEAEFSAEYPNYKESYYDFVLGSDWKVKTMIEHYLP